jgi:hypothetical protein
MGIGSKELLVLWVLLSIAVGAYARSKGTSLWFGLALSLVLSPLIGALIVAVHRPPEAVLEQRALASGKFKKCPACAELVKAEATRCKHCTQVLSTA